MTKVANACLYTTKTLGFIPSKREALVDMEIAAYVNCITTITINGLYNSTHPILSLYCDSITPQIEI